MNTTTSTTVKSLPANLLGYLATVHGIKDINDYGEFILGDTFESKWRLDQDGLSEVSPSFHRRFILEWIETTVWLHFTDQFRHEEKTLLFRSSKTNGEVMATHVYTLSPVIQRFSDDD